MRRRIIPLVRYQRSPVRSWGLSRASIERFRCRFILESGRHEMLVGTAETPGLAHSERFASLDRDASFESGSSSRGRPVGNRAGDNIQSART